MSRLHGLDHFCNHLKGLEAHYVVIEGGAASILMGDGGLELTLHALALRLGQENQDERDTPSETA